MKLVDGGLLAVEAQGRHRYFRIANAEVACMIESMAALASGTELGLPQSISSARSSTEAFMHARTCYDHLAGEIAVGVLASMQKARWLRRKDSELIATRLGEHQLRALGVDFDSARDERRVFARSCADLTQRRPHLGGALGAHMLNLYIGQSWIVRSPKSRLVSVTPKGNEMFRRLLELA
ncbi:transcriptional regulator [Burkholderia cepacia]|uniref:transcriptional regulator n=1 Tax=Burkholderia cepacia TaxID=292 RepID=UPI001E532E7B